MTLDDLEEQIANEADHQITEELERQIIEALVKELRLARGTKDIAKRVAALAPQTAKWFTADKRRTGP